MKKYFEIIYWLSAIVLMSLLFVSMTKSYSYALLLSVMMLPGVVFIKIFLKTISFKNLHTGILHTVYMLLIVLLIEYLCMLLVDFYFMQCTFIGSSEYVLNPFFIWSLLLAILSLEQIIKKKIIGKAEPDRFIEFTSERKKINIEINTILYIESRDDHVVVVTSEDKCYRTYMNITVWDNMLDDRFLRVHRSYIVNKSYIENFSSNSLKLSGGIHIDVSRKYRQQIEELFSRQI